MVFKGSVPVVHKIRFKKPNVRVLPCRESTTFRTMPTKICSSPQLEKICRSATGNQQGVEVDEEEEDG
jgi:hypothetical protein